MRKLKIKKSKSSKNIKDSKNTSKRIYSDSRKKSRKKRKILELFFRLLFSITIGVIVFAGYFLCFYRLETIQGYNMLPTLFDGDIILVKKDVDHLKRFDLVKCDVGSHTIIVRIVGLPEESIRYENDILYVNNEPVDEKFIVDEINQALKSGGEYTQSFDMRVFGDNATIPENMYLVLADNRPYGNDSRYYGLISEDNIKGVAMMRLFPLKDLINF